MSETLKKYETNAFNNLFTAEEWINEFYQAGYRIHTFTQGIDSEGLVQYTVVMSLKDDSKYDNITNLRDVPPSQVDDFLEKGWSVVESWSKIVRMVKR